MRNFRDKEHTIVYDQDHYVAIKFNAKIKPIDLLINMVNTMSLWRGTSFAFILSASIWIISHIGHILTKVSLINKFKYVYHDHIAIIILVCKVNG